MILSVVVYVAFEDIAIVKKHFTRKAVRKSHHTNDLIKEYPHLRKPDDSGKAFCTLRLTTFFVENRKRSQITGCSEFSKHKQ